MPCNMSTDNGVPEKADGSAATDLDADQLDDISGGAGGSPHQPGSDSYGGGSRPPTWGGYDPE